MKSNLLLNKVISIQNMYVDLLSTLLPKLKSNHAPEILDEINLFWIRNIDIIQLYLKYMFSGSESYVFTAATYIDFEDNEHLPFLLMGKKHIFDDPLSRYSEICNKMLINSSDTKTLYKQIIITIQDNIKILKNVENNILILPLRLFNQSNKYKYIFKIGEKTFINLFTGIENLTDYFYKCSSINDIMKYIRKDIDKLLIFSENDDMSLSFEKRFKITLSRAGYMIDNNKSDSYNFYLLIFGYLQQAIDIIVSCIEYVCIPYIRYPMTFHYVSLLLENMINSDEISVLRYKMNVAFMVSKLCDKKQLTLLPLNEFLKKNQEYHFDKKLFSTLEKNGINKDNFFNYKIIPFIKDELEKFYNIFSSLSVQKLI